MNCYNHHNDPAVATCIDCGKGLCNNCAHKYNIPICDNCNQIRIKNEKGNIVKNWIIIAILTLLLFPIFPKPLANNFIDFLIVSLFFLVIFYIAISIVYGWKFLVSITSITFLILPVIGWIIYFVVKLTLSCLIGFFVAPIKLYQDIKRYKELKETEKLIHN